MIPEYKKIETHVEDAILKKFGLRLPLSPAVKEADLRVLAAEQSQIMPPGTDDWAHEGNIVPAPIVVRHLGPEDAKRAFLDRYERLRRLYDIRQSQTGPSNPRSVDIGGKR
jgi:hypothetical protein